MNRLPDDADRSGGGGDGGGGGGGGDDTGASASPVQRAVGVTARVLYDMERQTPLTQPELGAAITRELPSDSRFSIVPSTLYRYRFMTYARNMVIEVFFAMLQVLYRDVPAGLEALARNIRAETGGVAQQSARAHRRQALLDLFDRLGEREQEVALGMMRGVLQPLAGALPVNPAAAAAAAAEEREADEEYAALKAELHEAGRQGTARQLASGVLRRDRESDTGEGGQSDRQPRARRHGNGG